MVVESASCGFHHCVQSQTMALWSNSLHCICPYHIRAMYGKCRTMVSVGCIKTKNSYNLPQSSSQNHLHPLPFVTAAFSLIDEILSSSWVCFHAGSSALLSQLDDSCVRLDTSAFNSTDPRSTRQIRIQLDTSAFDPTHLWLDSRHRGGYNLTRLCSTRWCSIHLPSM